MPTERFPNADPDISRRILGAAREEFLAKGFDGASLNRVLERAELSKGTFYYYFEDKADLYLTVISEAMAAVAGEGQLAVPDLSGGFWPGVHAFNRDLLRQAVAHPELMKLMTDLRDLSPKARSSPRLAPFYEMIKQTTTMVLEAGIATGDVRTDVPLGLLNAVLTAVGEAMDLWHLTALTGQDLAELDVEVYARRYTDMFRRVIAPPAVLCDNLLADSPSP